MKYLSLYYIVKMSNMDESLTKNPEKKKKSQKAITDNSERRVFLGMKKKGEEEKKKIPGLGKGQCERVSWRSSDRDGSASSAPRAASL